MADPLTSVGSAEDDERPSSLIDVNPPAPEPAELPDAAAAEPPPAPASAPPAPPAPPEDEPPPTPPPPAPPADDDTPNRPPVQSVNLSDTPMVAAITAAASFDELTTALDPLKGWDHSGDGNDAITRAKTYVSGSDREVLGGWLVDSVNEWKIRQQRILVLSKTAYYRVTYSAKTQRIDHYHKTPLSKVRVVEKTINGVKVYLTEQDGNANLGKAVMSLWNRNKAKDEFEHVREYLPVALAAGGASPDVVIDVLASSFHKAAELCSKGGGNFAVPALMTTEGRKGLLADRKEAERLRLEKEEREKATEELKAAMAAATESRAFDGLARPIKRCKRAVDVDAALLAEAEKLVTDLTEEKKERELAERLEKERVEREAAAEELSNAMTAARESRDAGALLKPMKRCKRAVDFPQDKLGEAEALKTELEEEKKAREAKELEDARLEKERVEREAAGEELSKAVAAATTTRDGAPPSPQEGGAAAMAAAAKSLDRPIKRAKKAVEFPAEALSEAEELKAALEAEEKKRKEEERLEKERVEREAATEELQRELEACTTSREPAALIKAIKRARKAVDVDEALITEADGLKAACEEEKRAAAQAAKEEAAAAKAEAAAAKEAAKAEAAEAAKAKAEAAAKAKEEASSAAAPADAEAATE